MAQSEIQLSFNIAFRYAQFLKVKQSTVQEMRWNNVSECRQNGGANVWNLSL